MVEKAHALMTRVGLEKVADNMAMNMSGGQQQRVAVARALAMNPDLVLADEPTGNLDTKSANSVFHLMREDNGESMTSFLLVTHNMDLAKRCDRIIELVGGHIIGSAIWLVCFQKNATGIDRPNDSLRYSARTTMQQTYDSDVMVDGDQRTKRRAPVNFSVAARSLPTSPRYLQSEMERMRNSLVRLVAIGAFSLALAGAKGGNEKLIETGRAIAQEKCAQCHAIGASGESLLEPAPPFRRILERRPIDNAREFARALATDHLQMPPFALSRRQVEALLAHMKSLKEENR